MPLSPDDRAWNRHEAQAALTGADHVGMSHKNYVEPPWAAPLDVAAALRSIPETATVTGMFLNPVVEKARRRGFELPSARERYVPFRFYPLREHAHLLVEACVRLYPELPMRQALRRLGRGAPQALVNSMIGKVVLGSAIGIEEIIPAMVKAYPLNLRPGRAEVVSVKKGAAIIRMEEVHYFLDSHHVGAFEGILEHAGTAGEVRICSYSESSADLLCTWG